jgi:hypothetical protein
VAGGLRLLDAVPSSMRGEPRGVRRYASLEALERETRTQLLLPFYFPDTLAWPPAAVYRAAGRGRPTAIAIGARASGETRLVIAQCLDPGCVIPERLLPSGRDLERTAIEIAGTRGWMSRRTSAAHGIWTDIEWHQIGRAMAVRIYGDDAEIARIAGSMRRGHP